MDVFEDAKHLCSWCGLSPSNNESAGKMKSVRIAKAGAYLKPLMVQCALAAIKSKKEPYFAIKYGRIKKRRSHKKAIIAIARMMMVCIYHMISELAPFNPTDYTELMDPHFNQLKVVLNDKNVFAYLKSQGYDPTITKFHHKISLPWGEYPLVQVGLKSGFIFTLTPFCMRFTVQTDG